MRRDTFKLLIFAGLLGFAVLYGMELSSKGIETVKGPWETQSPAPGNGANPEEEWTLPEPAKPRGAEPAGRSGARDGGEAGAGEDGYAEEEPVIPRDDREPIVDQLSGKTGEVLHDLSRNGIRFVVSLFDKVLG